MMVLICNYVDVIYYYYYLILNDVYSFVFLYLFIYIYILQCKKYIVVVVCTKSKYVKRWSGIEENMV